MTCKPYNEKTSYTFWKKEWDLMINGKQTTGKIKPDLHVEPQGWYFWTPRISEAADSPLECQSFHPEEDIRERAAGSEASWGSEDSFSYEQIVTYMRFTKNGEKSGFTDPEPVVSNLQNLRLGKQIWSKRWSVVEDDEPNPGLAEERLSWHLEKVEGNHSSNDFSRTDVALPGNCSLIDCNIIRRFVHYNIK